MVRQFLILVRTLTVCLLVCVVSVQRAQAQFDDNTPEPEVKIDKFIFSVGYQRAWRVVASDATTAEEEAYFKNLKRGGGIRLKGLVPLGDQNSAVGLIYSSYQSKTGRLMGASEFHEINFIGAVYQQYIRGGSENQHLWALESSLGYTSYQSVINGIDAFSGGNIGGALGGAYRYMVTPVIGIGVDLNFEHTTIQKWKGPTGQSFDLGDGDSLLRASLSFGVDIRL